MIKITNLNKSFGNKKVLENLNCNIENFPDEDDLSAIMDSSVWVRNHHAVDWRI